MATVQDLIDHLSSLRHDLELQAYMYYSSLSEKWKIVLIDANGREIDMLALDTKNDRITIG